MVSITSVRFDGGAVDALATATPSLQWEFAGDDTGWVQKSFEIRVTYGDGHEETHTGNSSNSQCQQWPGRPLASGETVGVAVRAAGEDDSSSGWSDTFSITAGILNNEWDAPFIAQRNQAVATHEEKISPEILFRSPQFSANRKLKKATVFCTALGVYQLEINGKQVSDSVLEPGWTSYHHRLLHQQYDVSALIQAENVIGGRVAAGWFSGWLGFDGGSTNIYGHEKALSLELRLQYADGTTDVITTNDSWRATDKGPITDAQLYNGEIYDATKEIDEWSQAGLDDSDWDPVVVIANPSKRVVPKSFGYTRAVDVIRPVDIIETPLGKHILDLGQNSVGVIHMKPVKAARGHKVTFKHAEVLEDGELGVRPLRQAKATDVYVFKGDDQGEEFTPRFTFHGCRYIQVENYPQKLELDGFEFRVISSSMDHIGTFECSDPLLNRLHQNVFHSTRGNFLSIPADCPQRDERMGWLGDIALFAPTGLYMFDSYNFLKSWLEDLKYEQEANGGFPGVVVPDVTKSYGHFWSQIYAAIWQDASVIIPWSLYASTRNTDVLVSQYGSMKQWYEFLPKIPGQIRWDEIRFQLGDWLDPTAPPDNPAKTMTDPYLVADAFLFLILTQLVETAKILDHRDDLEYFTKCRDQCKADFNREYVTESGRLTSESQTAYALTICFGLYLNDKQLNYGGERLANLCSANGFKIGTGFAGTPYVTEALTISGHLGHAYKMLLAKECPSWLYPVSMGATTIWERWDSMMPDGSINPGDMTSFNHYALGAVATWMHERIGGLAMGEPGYKTIIFKPCPGGGLTHCKTRHRAPSGWIESKWEVVGEKTRYSFKVPLNSSAEIELPNGDHYTVGSGSYSYVV